MEVQQTNIKTRMKPFHRVTTNHKSYYPCIKSLEKSPCQRYFTKWLYSTSRHDFLLELSVNTQN